MAEGSSVHQESTGLSVGRVFLVLETMAELGRPMTLTEVAMELDLPKSSMLKLLRGMSQLGYLAEDPTSKSYFPTPRICQLGRKIEDVLIGNSNVTPMLQDLRDETGESVSIAVQHGVMVEFHHCLSGRHQLTFSLTEGLRYPIYVAAAGRAIMASMKDGEVTKLLGRIKKARQKDWVPFDENELLDELSKIREQNFASSNPNLDSPVMSFAKMLPLEKGRRPIAVSVGGLRTRMEDNQAKLLGTMDKVIERYFSQ